MREQEFRAWFGTIKNKDGNDYTEKNLHFYVRNTRRIELVENKNLDKEFKKDEMASLLDIYTYSKNDNIPIKAKLEVKESTLPDYKTALNHYRKFCETNPPK